jgi:hypothetical protein
VLPTLTSDAAVNVFADTTLAPVILPPVIVISPPEPDVFKLPTLALPVIDALPVTDSNCVAKLNVKFALAPKLLLSLN